MPRGAGRSTLHKAQQTEKDQAHAMCTPALSRRTPLFCNCGSPPRLDVRAPSRSLKALNVLQAALDRHEHPFLGLDP
eukprot:2208921-Pleurochrysis_carterae.AAC.2